MHCDFFIIGAGPAGLASAIALARNGSSVVLAERDDFDRRRIGEHVPPEIKPLLSQLGYEADVTQHLSSPGVLSFWTARAEIERDYVFSCFGNGFNLSRPEFDAGLAGVARRTGVRLITRAKVELYDGPESWRFFIECPDGTVRVCARFAVDASGRQAWLARRLGIRRLLLSNEIAAIAYVRRCRNDLDNRLIVERSDSGWWYSLPLHNRTRAVAMVSGPADWAGPRKRREEHWSDQCAATRFIRNFVVSSARPGLTTCPAGIQTLGKICGKYWVAVGDAAVTFDPLAGRGICKALEDGLELPGVLAPDGGLSPIGLESFQSRVQRGLREHLATRQEYYSAGAF